MQEEQGTFLPTTPLVLVHRTHPLYARQIIEQGIFRANPHSTQPGMNAVLRQDARGDFAPAHTVAKGARLIFTWSGPVQAMPLHHGALAANVLYDDHPQRVVIGQGTTQYLRLVDVELEDGYSWADAIETPRSWLGHMKHLMTTSPLVLHGQALILGQKLETMAMQCLPIRIECANAQQCVPPVTLELEQAA